MSVAASIVMLVGGVIALLAGVGVLRFSTPYARFHAAGKASPMAFLVVATGAGLEMGTGGAVYLAIAAVAMTLTLPLGVHMLFRAAYRTGPKDHLVVDELAEVEEAGARPIGDSGGRLPSGTAPSDGAPRFQSEKSAGIRSNR